MVESYTDWRVSSAIPAIELIDVHCSLDGTSVLRGVSFGVEYGRITALIGPSGVGKTTTLRNILGLRWPDQGDVLVEGHSLLRMRRTQRLELAKRFGVLLQGAGVYGSALWDSLTVQQNLEQQLRAVGRFSEGEIAFRCQERLQEVGLASSAHLLPDALSSGMRRRLALARALAADPEIAVLDSFEMGADPVTLNRLCNLVARHHGRTGGTYLLATQSMNVVRRLADDVVVLWDGRVAFAGAAEELLDTADEDVLQLITGSVSGSLGMAQLPGLRAPTGRPAPPPGEQGFELPVPLVAIAVMVAITASAIFLGGAEPVELGFVGVLWVALVKLLLDRAERNRRTDPQEKRRDRGSQRAAIPPRS